MSSSNISFLDLEYQLKPAINFVRVANVTMWLDIGSGKHFLESLLKYPFKSKQRAGLDGLTFHAAIFARTFFWEENFQSLIVREQVGFRPECSCIDYTSTFRIMVEQCSDVRSTFFSSILTKLSVASISEECEVHSGVDYGRFLLDFFFFVVIGGVLHAVLTREHREIQRAKRSFVKYFYAWDICLLHYRIMNITQMTLDWKRRQMESARTSCF